MATLTFSNNRIKKPYQSKENILTIHSPKNCCIDIANTISIDTGLTIKLPEKSTVYLATKFMGRKNNQNRRSKNTEALAYTFKRILF